MITAYQIRRSPLPTKLFFIVAPALLLTGIASFIVPGFIGGYYNNMVLHSPTVWYDAPASLLAWAPVLDACVFVVMTIVLYMFLDMRVGGVLE
jgi:hypothetical protein